MEQVGLAQARATQAQVNAFGGPQYQLTPQVMARFAAAVERGHIDIVRKVMVGGGADGACGNPLGGNMLGALVAMMLSGQAGLSPLSARNDQSGKGVSGDIAPLPCTSGPATSRGSQSYRHKSDSVEDESPSWA